MKSIKLNIERHFIYLFACMLISTLVVWLCIKIKSDTEKKLAYSEMQFRSSEQAFKSATEALDQYFSYFPFMQSLQAEGVLGPENRLQWVETLQKIAYEQKIPLIQYSIEPIQYLTEISVEGASDLSSITPLPDSENPPLPEAPLVISKSQMALSFGITHEQSLLKLLIDLEKLTHGIPTIESCDIQRTKLDLNMLAQESSLLFSQITGVCKIHWYTFMIQESFVMAQ